MWARQSHATEACNLFVRISSRGISGCAAFCLQAGCRERSSRIRDAIHNLAPELLHAKRSFTRAATDRPGFYPIPIGTAGISAVDIRDIAEAAAITLTENGHEGKTYDLVGPTLIDGPGVAALWSKLLGKNVRYGGHHFDRWEQEMRSHVPAWMAFDFRTMYQAYFDRGFASTASQASRLTELLGHPPRATPSLPPRPLAGGGQPRSETEPGSL